MVRLRCARLCAGLKPAKILLNTLDLKVPPLVVTSLNRCLSTSAYTVETVVERSCNSIGEGPHWEEKTQSLLYVDIHDGVVHRWFSQTGQNESHKFNASLVLACTRRKAPYTRRSFCSLIVPCEHGGYIISINKTICHFDWVSKRIKPLGTVDGEKRTRLNDGKCDASGRLWFGTMGLEKSPAVVHENQGALYSLEQDGTIRQHKDGISISNGLAWTSDNKTLYYIDSIPRKVYAFDFDITKGSISNERVAVDFGGDETMSSLGYPDGMTIDTDGNIWVACYSVGRVVQFNPNTGEEIGSVSVPARRTTSCCFGGQNYDEMFVTCSRYGLTEAEKVETPLAGSLFRITGLGIKGTPAYAYTGNV